MLKTLIDIRSKDPLQKSIIFSQWARLLKLTGDALRDNGFRFAYLSGKNRYGRYCSGDVVDAAGSTCVLICLGREEELNAFRTHPDVTVLMVSMKTGGGAAGLTLTMATTGT